MPGPYHVIIKFTVWIPGLLLTSVSVLVWMLNPLSFTMPLYDFASFEGHTGENLLSFFL